MPCEAFFSFSFLLCYTFIVDTIVVIFPLRLFFLHRRTFGLPHHAEPPLKNVTQPPDHDGTSGETQLVRGPPHAKRCLGQRAPRPGVVVAAVFIAIRPKTRRPPHGPVVVVGVVVECHAGLHKRRALDGLGGGVLAVVRVGGVQRAVRRVPPFGVRGDLQETREATAAVVRRDADVDGDELAPAAVHHVAAGLDRVPHDNAVHGPVALDPLLLGQDGERLVDERAVPGRVVAPQQLARPHRPVVHDKLVVPVPLGDDATHLLVNNVDAARRVHWQQPTVHEERAVADNGCVPFAKDRAVRPFHAEGPLVGEPASEGLHLPGVQEVRFALQVHDLVVPQQRDDLATAVLGLALQRLEQLNDAVAVRTAVHHVP
eukprot:PhM_4_TR17501/c0_g1_i1/m.5192